MPLEWSSNRFFGSERTETDSTLKEKRRMSDQDDVFGGVDTHRDVHVAAVVDATGRVLGTASFGADTAGYEQLGHWLGSHGNVAHVGIEGTGSYGAGAGVGRNGAGNGEVSRNTGAEDRSRSKEVERGVYGRNEAVGGGVSGAYGAPNRSRP